MQYLQLLNKSLGVNVYSEFFCFPDHLLAIDEEGNTVIIEHKNSDAFGNISISSLQIPDNTKRYFSIGVYMTG